MYHRKKTTTTKLGEPCAENKGIDQPVHQKNATKTSSVYSEDSFGGMCKPCDNIYVNTFAKMRILPTAVSKRHFLINKYNVDASCTNDKLNALTALTSGCFP